MPTRPLFPSLISLGFAVAFAPLLARPLALREDSGAGTLSVLRAGESKPVVVQNAGPQQRPYVHPLVAPDGKGVLTQAGAGIYWAFDKLNGRDYAQNAGAGYWQRVSTSVLVAQGEEVKWSTTYNLLGADGKPVLLETQTWTMHDAGDRYLLEVEWKGEAQTEVTVGESESGGLFVRTPWKQGLEGSVVNSNRQRNERGDGQRAVWSDVGLKAEGRSDLAHIAIFDHPLNNGYPLAWHVDHQLGVNPSRSIAGEWKIAKEKPAIFRHQLVVYTGALNDVRIDEDWRNYTGERSDAVLWNLARAEGKKGETLTGQQAVAKMTVPEGYEMKLYASEPAITQPMAFCWDDRGRLWVAENRDYEGRKTGFSGSGDSRILILEDTDGDGVMDTKKVFIEKIPFPSAIAVGFDGIFLGAPPNLLFIPDRNHDDKADGEIQVRLTGWGIADRHEVLNSLSWGPDGWLYGCQGYATPSKVGKPVGAGRVYKPGEPFPTNPEVQEGQFIDGGVWRYHPTKDRFEIVAHGFSNPWGLDFDDHGQMFITACVIPHLWHVIQGGIYHRQGGKHINPYVYQDIKTIADHRHRSAHGGARIYLADEFPQEYRNRIFMANIHERALLTDILEPQGSGFVGKHGDDTVLANDPMWVGFSLEIGPDGAIYILDWHDQDICGQLVNNKDTGRIFRFAPKGLPGKTGIDIAAKTDLELVELQSNHNDWYVRRARLQLQQRAAAGKLGAGVAEKLWELFNQAPTSGGKLRALWALHVTKNLPAEKLAPLLDHAEPYIRAWAIQLLCEDAPPPAPTLAKFARMAASERSAVVRLYLASAMQRIPLDQRWPIAEALLRHGEDADDHNLPNMIWFGVEPLVAANTTKALALANGSQLSLLTNFIARRATATKQIEAIVDAIAAAKAGTRKALLEGLRDGVTSLGRREVSAPKNWAAASTALIAADASLQDLVTGIGQLFGDPKASAAQLAILKDASAPVEKRREILQSFARDSYMPALDMIIALLGDATLRRDAIRALASYDSPRVSNQLLRRYDSFAPSEKAEAVLTLSGRKTTADPLVAALKNGTIPKRDISAYAARQLQRVVGPSFVDFWGSIAQPAEDKQAEMQKLKRELTDDVLAKSNPSKGRAIFERTCFACHTLYGQGGKIGPDLTGSNRANLDYILTEILNPSEVIQEGYHLVTITTRDGRTLAGNVVAEDDQQVTLRLIGQDTVVAKSEIASREKSNISMMPEGLLKTLSSEEVHDLIAYLRTTQQVPLPK